MRQPDYAVFLESRMHNERCTSGSERDYGKPTAEKLHGARNLLQPYIPMSSFYKLDRFAIFCARIEILPKEQVSIRLVCSEPYCCREGSFLALIGYALYTSITKICLYLEKTGKIFNTPKINHCSRL